MKWLAAIRLRAFKEVVLKMDRAQDLGEMTARVETIVQSKADLYALKHLFGADEVIIDLSSLKLLGLAHHAIRLAFFAVRPGGKIILRDETASSEQIIGPYKIGWPSLRALALRALSRDCRREVSDNPAEMLFTRLTKTYGLGWSAGVIFSGSEAELPQLFKCLDGLLAQNELTGDTGEIIVSGPLGSERLLDGYPTVKFHAFDVAPDEYSAFPISRKKNALMQTMLYPRKLVLHTRMVLAVGALAAAPNDFDILAPNVVWTSERGTEPNIGFVTIDASWPAMTARGFERTTTMIAPAKYLDLVVYGRPYADGAAFAVTDRVLTECQLHPELLWGDCEDVEWCLRAQTLGFLVDMCVGLIVTNQKSKIRTLEGLPGTMSRGIRRINRFFRHVYRTLNVG